MSAIEAYAQLLKTAASGERPHSMIPGRTTKSERGTAGTAAPLSNPIRVDPLEEEEPKKPKARKAPRASKTPKAPGAPKVDISFSVKVGAQQNITSQSTYDPQPPPEAQGNTGANVDGAFQPSNQVGGSHGTTSLPEERDSMRTPALPSGESGDAAYVGDVKMSEEQPPLPLPDVEEGEPEELPAEEDLQELLRRMKQQNPEFYAKQASETAQIAPPTSGIGTDTAVNAGIGAVGFSAPFMGLIGESKITKDPFYNAKIKRMSYKALSRMAKPGDVLLTSSREGPGYYKMPQELVTGSEFYHAEPVAFKGNRGTITTEAGRYDPAKPGSKFQKDTVESILDKGKGTPMRTRVGDKASTLYENTVLMRPKKGMKPEDLAAYQKQLVTRGREHYSNPLALRAWLRDIFMPKIKGVTDRVSPLGDGCKGEMCSSLPSGAYEKTTGTKVVPGKHSRSVLPADLLRNNSAYEAVGSTIKGPNVLLSPGRRLAHRLALRGGIGTAIAGTGLLAYNEPEALGGVAAGLAAPAATRALVNKIQSKKLKKLPTKGSLKRKLYDKFKRLDMYTELPQTTQMVVEREAHKERVRRAKLRGRKSPKMTVGTRKLVRNFLKKKLGLAAGVGLGTYGTIKGVEHLIRNNPELAKESSAFPSVVAGSLGLLAPHNYLKLKEEALDAS